MSDDIYVGTSGYDYTSWRGVFYPEKLPRKDFLSFYSEYFNGLEINNTYYRMPDEYQFMSMIKKTDGKLKFCIKGNNSFTHQITNQWKESVKIFCHAIRPLLNRELLLSVLLQFPQSFHYKVEERKYLSALLHEFHNDVPLVIEFRHNSWEKDSVYQGLQERNVGCCIADVPALKYLPSNKNIMTGNAAYIRFHGRNNQAWYCADSRDRYEYFYNDSELESYVPVIRKLSGKARLIQIYMNNHAKGYAVINARKLINLLFKPACQTMRPDKREGTKIG